MSQDKCGDNLDVPENGRRSEPFEQELRSFWCESVLVAQPLTLANCAAFPERTAGRVLGSRERDMGYQHKGVMEPVFGSGKYQGAFQKSRCTH